MKTRKPYRRNSLYALLVEYLKHNPCAMPGQAWAHFSRLAQQGLVPTLLSFDGRAIEVVPDPERLRTKKVSHQAFARQFQKIRSALLEKSS